MKHLKRHIKRTQKTFCSWIMSLALIVSPSLEAASKKQSSIELQKAALTKHLNIFKSASAKNGNPIKYKDLLPSLNKILPAHQRRSMALLSRLDPNATAPHAELKSIKGPDGREILRIIFTPENPRDAFTVDFIGKKKSVIKVNGISLSYSDVYYPARAQKKLSKISYFKKEEARTRHKILSASIVPSDKALSKMTLRQKAEYLIKLRRVVEASVKVQDAFTKKGRKTSQIENHPRPFENFSQLLINPAWAEENEKEAESDTASVTTNKCVNAGWITSFDNDNKYCDHFNVTRSSVNSDKVRDLFLKYRLECPQKGDNYQNYVPCNPLIYGGLRPGATDYDPKKFKPICIPAQVGSAESNQASTQNGKCERESPLKDSTNKLEQINEMVKFLSNDKACKSGIYKTHYSTSQTTYSKTVKTDKASQDCIISAIKEFNEYKDEIIKYCENEGGEINITPDKNQPAACEALKLRILNINEFIDKTSPKPLSPTNPIPPKTDTPSTPESDPEQDCDFMNFYQEGETSVWCSIGEGLLVAGLIASGVGLVCWAAGCSDDDEKVQQPPPITPVPPKGKLPIPPPDPPPPAENTPPTGTPPPPAPKPDEPKPMNPPPEEGGGNTDTINGDGIRRFKATK